MVLIETLNYFKRYMCMCLFFIAIKIIRALLIATAILGTTILKAKDRALICIKKRFCIKMSSRTV